MPVTVTTDEDDNEITVESQSNAVLSISLFIREKKGGGVNYVHVESHTQDTDGKWLTVIIFVIIH